MVYAWLHMVHSGCKWCLMYMCSVICHLCFLPQLEAHLDPRSGDCPLAEVPCPFKPYGCTFVVSIASGMGREEGRGRKSDNEMLRMTHQASFGACPFSVLFHAPQYVCMCVYV